jgi:hypothetical protein
MAYKTTSERVEESKRDAERHIDVLTSAYHEASAEAEALTERAQALIAEIDSYDWAPGELPDDVWEAVQKLRELV